MTNKKLSGLLCSLLFFCLNALGGICPNCSREGYDRGNCIHSDCPLNQLSLDETEYEYGGIDFSNHPVVVFDTAACGSSNPVDIYLQQIVIEQSQSESRKEISSPQPLDNAPPWISYVYHYTPKTADTEEPDDIVPILDNELDRAQDSDVGYSELQPGEDQDLLDFLQQHLNLFEHQYLLFYQMEELAQIYIIEVGSDGILHIFSDVSGLWNEIEQIENVDSLIEILFSNSFDEDLESINLYEHQPVSQYDMEDAYAITPTGSRVQTPVDRITTPTPESEHRDHYDDDDRDTIAE